MSLATVGLLAPAVKGSFRFDFSSVEIIVIVIAVLGAVAIFGWRSPDRSPGEESKAQRDRIDD
jgi:hypothetical protein